MVNLIFVTHLIFKHAESKSRLYTQDELYSFKAFCPSFCQNSQRFPWNAMLLGKIRMSDFTGIYAPQKFHTTHQITSTQELTVQLKNTALWKWYCYCQQEMGVQKYFGHRTRCLSAEILQ